jgi:23S rRNA pseudouridine2604 synthase
MNQQEGTQINKYISSSGFCSRREADKLIEQGRVTINGRLALPTSRVSGNERVAIDDETVRVKKKEGFYIAFNKPTGITSTTNLQDKSNIISFINHNRRIFPVGRLDKDSEGLILLTDDGDIVNKILRAENGHEKEYIVTVNKPIAGEFIQKMASGVPILDTVTLPCKVKQEGNKKFRITLTQGLNRQIRRMCEYMGYEVSSLKRVRIMHIQLGDLAAGKFRKLLPSELEKLQETISDSSGLSSKDKVRSKKQKSSDPEKELYAPAASKKPRTSASGKKTFSPADPKSEKPYQKTGKSKVSPFAKGKFFKEKEKEVPPAKSKGRPKPTDKGRMRTTAVPSAKSPVKHNTAKKTKPASAFKKSSNNSKKR